MEQYALQTDKPLFPKVLWNRPINKTSAGRLMLVGGHKNDFQAVQAIYQFCVAAGIGQCTTVLPDSLRTLLQAFDDTYFVPSSPSGSIGKAATAELLHLATEYDGLSIGANLSNNSETAVVIERLVGEAQKPTCLYLDALDVFSFKPALITNRTDCLILATMPELFKLAGKLKVALAIRPERGLLGRVELAQQVAEAMKASLVCAGKELIVISGGQTSVTTDISARLGSAVGGVCSVFWTQRQSFESLRHGCKPRSAKPPPTSWPRTPLPPTKSAEPSKKPWKRTFSRLFETVFVPRVRGN